MHSYYNDRVAKRIAPSGAGEDLDLNNNLSVIFARRVTASTQLNNLESHAGGGSAVRGASPNQLAIATGTMATPQPPTTAPPTTAPPGNTLAPVRAPENYHLQILSPTGCSRADCDLFIGIDTNTGDNGFLDIYMEGTAEGWVAVGFSETANMVSKINKIYCMHCLCVLHSFQRMWCLATDRETLLWPLMVGTQPQAEPVTQTPFKM